MEGWPRMENPVDALELLDARYADELVRNYAVNCLEEFSNDGLDDYLLQLVQVLFTPSPSSPLLFVSSSLISLFLQISGIKI